MKIKDRPEYSTKTPILTFSPDTVVYDAVHEMSRRNFGAVVIVDPDSKPLGIVSERDFMRRLIDKELDPRQTKVSEIMTRELRVAKPEDEVIDWLRQMSNERFRHLPIVYEQGKIVNIMSQGDFVSYTWPVLVDILKEKIKVGLMNQYQWLVIAAGIMVYTLLMIVIMR